MDMGRVVPTRRESIRVAVEDDAAADEHEPVDVLLDGAELVRAKEDCHAEVPVELLEESGECLLRVHVDTGRRLVEDEQIRARGECLREERALLLPSREPAQDRPSLAREVDSFDRLVDDGAITATEEPARNEAASDDFADRHRRVDAELCPLREVSDPSSARELGCRLPEQERLAPPRLLEADRDTQERRLAAAVRPGDGDELSGLDLEVDIVQDLGPTGVGEADVRQLDG
jgi:hypothetical protein